MGPPARARSTRPPSDSWSPLWIEPFPDEQLGLSSGYASPEARYEEREAVELAFIAALQHLPPRQRAALILREVLGFSAKEVAEALGATVASVNGALQRARKAADERLPERSQQANLRSLGDERARDLVRRFSAAFEVGDVDAILSMLAEDATFSMPPYPTGAAAASDRRLLADAGRGAAAPALPRDPRERPAGARHLSPR